MTGLDAHFRPATILTVGEVARLLHCSIDTVRRLSHSDLPCARIGRENLYLLMDVEALIRKRQGRFAPVENLKPKNLHNVINSLADDVRERSR